MAVALFFDALAPLLPLMAQSHGLSDAVFQVLLGCSFASFALAQLACVPIISAIGLYRAAGLSCLALGLCAGVVSMAPNGVVFAAAFLAMFLVNSVGSNATRVALRNAAGEMAFKRLLAWASSAVELKQIAMPFITGVIAAAIGWRWTLLAIVAPAVLAGVWIEVERAMRSDDRDARLADRSAWRRLLREPQFLRPTLAAGGFQIAFAPIAARLPFMLADQSDAALSVGLVLSLSSAAVAAGLALTGWLAARVSSPSLIKTGMAIMALGGVVAITGSFHGLPWTITGVIVVQSAFGFVMVTASADALNVEERQRTAAAALFGFVQPVIGGVAVALTGMLSSDHGAVVVASTLVAIVAMGLAQSMGRWAPSRSH